MHARRESYLTPAVHQHLISGRHLVPSAWRTPHSTGMTRLPELWNTPTTQLVRLHTTFAEVRRPSRMPGTTTTPSLLATIFPRPRQQPPPIARARLAGTTLGMSSPSTCGPHISSASVSAVRVMTPPNKVSPSATTSRRRNLVSER